MPGRRASKESAEITVEDMWSLSSNKKNLFNGREGGRTFHSMLVTECPLWQSEHVGYSPRDFDTKH